MLSDLTARVWQRLIARESLADLRLPLTEEGRIDLRRLVAPQPSIAREYQTAAFRRGRSVRLCGLQLIAEFRRLLFLRICSLL